MEYGQKSIPESCRQLSKKKSKIIIFLPSARHFSASGTTGSSTLATYFRDECVILRESTITETKQKKTCYTKENTTYKKALKKSNIKTDERFIMTKF